MAPRQTKELIEFDEDDFSSILTPRTISDTWEVYKMDENTQAVHEFLHWMLDSKRV